MKVNLHVTQKISNENGTTSVLFKASLADDLITVLQCDNIMITIPTAGDIFEIAADYQGEMVKVVPEG